MTGPGGRGRDVTGGRDTGGGGKGLDYEARTLTAFKGRIDEILGELEKSPASRKHIGDQTIVPDAYGTGFSAAEDLSALYDSVHARLESLSQLFGDQLEALGIATQIVDKGYENIEADQVERFQSVQTRVEEYREAHQGGAGKGRDSGAEIIDDSDGTDFR